MSVWQKNFISLAKIYNIFEHSGMHLLSLSSLGELLFIQITFQIHKTRIVAFVKVDKENIIVYL